MLIKANFDRVNPGSPKVRVILEVDFQGEINPSDRGWIFNKNGDVRLWPQSDQSIALDRCVSIDCLNGDEAEEVADSIADDVFRQFSEWKRCWESIRVPRNRVYHPARQRCRDDHLYIVEQEDAE